MALPSPSSLVAALRTARPAALALQTADDSWSGVALGALAGRLAGDLAARGVQPGQAVAWRGGALELTFAALACAWRGTALLPLAPDWPPQRCAALVAQCGAEHEYSGVPPEGEALEPMPAAAEAPALIIATSGSEGTPKAVMLSGRSLAAQAASAAMLDLVAGDVWLHCLPLHHIGGQAILHRCWHAGAAVRLAAGFDLERIAAALPGTTHVSLVPAQLARLVEAGIAPPASLRVALVGGGPLSRPVFERAHAAGWPVCPTYGMSETAAQLATALRPAPAAWQEGCVGSVLPGMTARVDAAGRLTVAGPQLMLGYANPARRPGDGLSDGEFVTADRASIDAAGRITVLGRADDVFVSGGVNVDPAEVEGLLAGCPGLDEVAVVGLPDPVWGAVGVALVAGAASVGEIETWSRAHLPAALRPRRFRHVVRLPRNDMGKLARAELRALAGDAA